MCSERFLFGEPRGVRHVDWDVRIAAGVAEICSNNSISSSGEG